ncbi:M15 family metallopeptidase [Streptomyces sp. NPDC048606]|uniref:M15 family metallopeptidase n=1 Tax=Streptomyces sp. NPDC048606 TaxID=3154726 RepID=UPI003424223A
MRMVVVAVLVALVVPSSGPAAPATGSAATGSAASGSAATRSSATGSAGPGRDAGFVALRDVDPGIAEDVRYAGTRNFTGGVVDGYAEPVCLLTRPAARALRRAQRDLLRRGYGLKVYDCYRPQRAVDRFVRWAAEPDDPAAKAEFYPDVDKGRLIPEGYIAERSGHSRGATVDVTLVWPVGGREVDMGTPFDFFGPPSHTDSGAVSEAARANRRLLRGVLGGAGFVNLREEWWHFTLRSEPFPDTYFDFPVSVASVRP